MKNAHALNVVFVDDNDELLKAWRRMFERGMPRAGVAVQENSRDATKDAILALDQARLKTRQGKKVAVAEGADLFDNADLVFVDYDLMEMGNTTALTGEDIAYLLRCFSKCGFIVLLNPPDMGTRFFDLRLRRSLESWADLAVGSDQLNNSWFWRDATHGFAPWSWPILLDAVARRQKQIADVSRSLGKSVFELLAIPQSAQVAMDHVMVEPVCDGASRTPCSLREFVLRSGYGVHRKDNEKNQFGNSDEAVSRICASRLSAWLEHVVLPAQNLIVDAPHLASRLPALLAGDPADMASWNPTCVRDEKACAVSLRSDEIKSLRFAKPHWLSRPGWFWPLMVGNRKYAEWSFAEKLADAVFCEDTSSFVRRAKAHEFMADVPPQFARRFVERLVSSSKGERIDYRPSIRLSM